MSASIENITVSSVEDLLIMLYGGELLVKQVPGAKMIHPPRMVACYVDKTGAPQHAIVTDLYLANAVGAALSRIPVGYASDCAKTGEIPDNIRDNLHEVLNIGVSLFAGSSRLVLGEVYYPGASPDARLEALIAGADCLAFEVSIGSYSKGRLYVI